MIESVRDIEEEIVGQKDDGKLGMCDIQWQQNPPFIDRKFSKKNFNRLDDVQQMKQPLSLSITKIEEERDDVMEIIPLTSPMKVRSPLGYRSSYNIEEGNPSSCLNVLSNSTAIHSSLTNIKTISHTLPPPQPENLHENLRKSSLLSLKSLSTSLRMLKNRGRNDSFETVEPTTLETIDETSRRSSIFRLDVFEKNLKKFVTKSNEAEFQSFSEYQQQQQNAKTKPKTYFKNQKVHARRSSMSDINDPNQIPHPKTLQQHPSGMSTSSTNVKHQGKTKEETEKEKHKKSVDKTAEMLKEVRKRNMETSKRIQAPRRISNAH